MEVVPGTSLTPRDAIRRYGLENTEAIGKFFEDLLQATRKIWFSCPSCKRRAQVEVPDWGARVRGMETMLSEGFGKPEAVVPDENEQLRAVARATVKSLSEKQLRLIAGSEDFQQEFLAAPWTSSGYSPPPTTTTSPRLPSWRLFAVRYVYMVGHR